MSTKGKRADLLQRLILKQSLNKSSDEELKSILLRDINFILNNNRQELINLLVKSEVNQRIRKKNKKLIAIEIASTDDESDDVEDDAVVDHESGGVDHDSHVDDKIDEISDKLKCCYKLDALPCDVIGEISIYLSQRYYAAFQRTCSKMYVSLNNRGIKLYKLSFSSRWLFHQFQDILRYHQNIKALKIESRDTCMMKLCKSYKFRKLRELQIFIPQSTDAKSFKLLNAPISWDYTQLISLSLHGDDEEAFDISSMKEALSMCTNLLNLELMHWHETQTWYGFDIPLLPNLVSLSLFESLGFQVIQSCGHHLRELKLFGIDLWVPESQTKPLRYPNHKRVQSLKSIHFTKLTTLDFGASHYNEIAAIISTAINLRFVKISNDLQCNGNGETIGNLVNLIMTKCTKLERIFFEVWDLSPETENNSCFGAYEGLIAGLKQTLQVRREKLEIVMSHGMLSLDQLEEIINLFKIGGTDTMILHYREGNIYHDDNFEVDPISEGIQFWVERVVNITLEKTPCILSSFQNVSVFIPYHPRHKKQAKRITFTLTLQYK